MVRDYYFESFPGITLGQEILNGVAYTGFTVPRRNADRHQRRCVRAEALALALPIILLAHGYLSPIPQRRYYISQKPTGAQEFEHPRYPSIKKPAGGTEAYMRQGFNERQFIFTFV